MSSKRFKISMFRACDNREGCLRFKEGHVRILEDYGISNVSTNEETWMSSESVFVLMAEESSNMEVVGGIRIHLKEENVNLPIQDAIGDLDPRIHDIVSKSAYKVGEICGMWNSRKYFGYGISAVLGRASVAYSKLIGVDMLFCLAAKYILDLAEQYGFRIVEEIGNQGTFKYPIETHLAHVLRINDIDELKYADRAQKGLIDSMRQNLNCSYFEESVKGNYFVEFEIDENLHQ